MDIHKFLTGIQPEVDRIAKGINEEMFLGEELENGKCFIWAFAVAIAASGKQGCTPLCVYGSMHTPLFHENEDDSPDIIFGYDAHTDMSKRLPKDVLEQVQNGDIAPEYHMWNVLVFDGGNTSEIYLVDWSMKYMENHVEAILANDEMAFRDGVLPTNRKFFGKPYVCGLKEAVSTMHSKPFYKGIVGKSETYDNFIKCLMTSVIGCCYVESGKLTQDEAMKLFLSNKMSHYLAGNIEAFQELNENSLSDYFL